MIKSVYGTNFARYPEGERQFAEALHRQCPDWHVIHSMTYLGATRRRYEEGESDFIVFVPDRGFIVVEVKAAREFFRDQYGWGRFEGEGPRRVRRYYRTLPWVQASRAMHQYKDYLKTCTRCRGMNFGYGFAVCFPRADIVGPTLGITRTDAGLVDGDPNGFLDVTLTRGDLPNLASRLRDTMDRWTVRRPGCNVQELFMALAGHDPLELAPPAISRVVEVQNGLARLTREQFDALSACIPDNPRVAVLGGPGTGKTIIARHQALSWAQAGKRVLYLCFNKNLNIDNKDYFSKKGVGNRVTTDTFHSFAFRLFDTYGRPLGHRWPEPATDPFFQRECCEGLADIIESHIDALRPDALVVDEAQDLNGVQLATLLNLQPPRVLVLSDPDQNLFAEPGAGRDNIPADFAKCRLTINCRNPREIGWCVPKCIGRNPDMQSLSRSPRADVRPRCVWNPMAVDPWVSIRTQLTDWLTRLHLPANQIAVLCAHSSTCDEVKRNVATVEGHRITSDLAEWRAGDRIFVGTIRSFKGLDATAVLLHGLECPPTLALTESDVYVAVSRAKFDLAVVPKDQAAYQWFRDLFTGDIPEVADNFAWDDLG